MYSQIVTMKEKFNVYGSQNSRIIFISDDLGTWILFQIKPRGW